MLISLNIDGSVAYANQKVSDLLGYTKEELKSEDKKVRKSALSTLSQLSKTLQLTMLQPALNAISEAVNYKKRLKAIEQFYATLIKITTLTPPSGQPHSPKGSTKNSVPPYNKFDAEPYNYHKVAKELSLPKKLIHSLLKDFVTGTKRDILRMKQHLTQGESSEVKQIIHSLKGAANNLRLHTISHILSTINQSTSLSDTTKNLKQLKKQIDLLQKQL
jgi:HPt (histidine-containing phosphotransfer) domain-containing protein